MSARPPRTGRLATSPIVRHGGRWWLVSDAGSIPATDPAFAAELDRLATAMAAADRAVADLRAAPNTPPTPGSGR
ncbi:MULTISPECIES: hypothetical protein [unclassified Streptomyces]|uniref:hypothetical protein n=1 Tax=unclassified Streptomyces TaxID=2593676 RepID=UPI002E2AAB19|nr:hypothetical protein [Streptomyces sp. NBC_00223]